MSQFHSPLAASCPNHRLASQPIKFNQFSKSKKRNDWSQYLHACATIYKHVTRLHCLDCPQGLRCLIILHRLLPANFGRHSRHPLQKTTRLRLKFHLKGRQVSTWFRFIFQRCTVGEGKAHQNITCWDKGWHLWAEWWEGSQASHWEYPSGLFWAFTCFAH